MPYFTHITQEWNCTNDLYVYKEHLGTTTLAFKVGSLLRRSIEDVNLPHVYGNSSYRGASCHCLPLWPKPTNIRQSRTQTKLMHVKEMSFPATLWFCKKQHFLSVQNIKHLRNLDNVWARLGTITIDKLLNPKFVPFALMCNKE